MDAHRHVAVISLAVLGGRDLDGGAFPLVLLLRLGRVLVRVILVVFEIVTVLVVLVLRNITAVRDRVPELPALAILAPR